MYLRRGSVIIFWEQFDAKYLHQVSYLFDACKKPTSIAEQVVWFWFVLYEVPGR